MHFSVWICGVRICEGVRVYIDFFLVYEIKLGTVDQAEVDTEWRLRPYMNTARKRLALSEPDVPGNS